MSEDVTNYGATPNDSKDDTDAFIDAIDAAAGGTVYIPEGTFTINSKRHRGGGAIHISSEENAGTSFVGAGPDKTTVKMEGDHTYTYLGIVYSSSVNNDDAVVRDFTFDGNQWNQGPRPDGETPPNGFAIKVNGSKQDVLVENCRIKDWSTTGGLYNAKGITIRHCSFLNCGAAVWENGGWRGHGLNSSNDCSSDDERGLLVDSCYFTGSSGTSIDNHGGNLTMRSCVTEDQQFAIKYQDGNRTTVEHSRWRNLSYRGIYTVHSNGNCGRLQLRDVALEDIESEALASKLDGTVEGNNILLDNTNTESNHLGEAVMLDDKSVSIGTIAVLNTPQGSAFNLERCSGSIDELIVNNNADGVGSLSNVSVGTQTSADSYAADVPSASEVGVNASSTDSTTYDHTLEVKADTDTTYAITVSGQAIKGDQADPKETVTEQSDGTYLLEGVVLSGGTDSFEFNGEVLPDQTTIDGDATLYVDGSANDLTTYDHTLRVEAENDATYAVTVSGEATDGDQADSGDTVSGQSDGSSLIEGTVSSDDSDSFEFNGEVLPDQTNIDSGVTLYVDGSALDISPFAHTLRVEAASDTTYAITVSGEAIKGDQADPKESITAQSDGTYLLEGTVLSGGVDSFKFDGEVLPDQTTIDGDATLYVDGDEISLDTGSEIGDYEQPQPGSSNWHEPLNQNFEAISNDVQEMAARIEQLEKQLN